MAEEQGAPRKVSRRPPHGDDPAVERPPPLRVLVVDDEQNIRQMLALCLRKLGCEVVEAATGTVALEALRERPFDLAFCDLRLEQENGLGLLPQLLSAHPGLDVVMITAYGSIDSAVEAMRLGARDYLQKPFTPAQIRSFVDRSAARRGTPTDAPVVGGNFTADELEREHVLRVIARTSTLEEASRILGMDVTTLWRKRKKWGR